MSTIRTSLELIPLRDDRRDAFEVACPACGGGLAIHQPDKRRPTRLLGTCRSCPAWYLIDADAALMCRLPDGGAFRED